jgi:hypothetical protein
LLLGVDAEAVAAAAQWARSATFDPAAQSDAASFQFVFDANPAGAFDLIRKDYAP